MLELAPSDPIIKAYIRDLQHLKDQKISHELGLKGPFQNLLDKAAKKRGWTLIPELSTHSGGKRVVPDGTVRDEFRLARGWWEAKDTSDNLAAEISRLAPRKGELIKKSWRLPCGVTGGGDFSSSASSAFSSSSSASWNWPARMCAFRRCTSSGLWISRFIFSPSFFQVIATSRLHARHEVFTPQIGKFDGAEFVAGDEDGEAHIAAMSWSIQTCWWQRSGPVWGPPTVSCKR
jgi:hypothetical protein